MIEMEGSEVLFSGEDSDVKLLDERAFPHRFGKLGKAGSDFFFFVG